jgi:glycosyltransferase involved in cell wall biosynthesis
MTRPRIAHVTTTDISLLLLLGPQLAAFARAGYQVLGISAPGPYVAALEAQGIEHVPLRHATRSVAPWRDAAALSELQRTFERLRPDVVHTHNPKPGIYGRIAAHRARVPAVVNTVHGLYAQPGDPWAKRAAVYALERAAARYSHAELVQNPEDLETLARLGVDRSKLHLLGNGIDLDRFDPQRVPAGERESRRRQWGIGAGDVVCGVVGRLVWEKGLREVADAARRLRRRVPHLRIVVVGPADGAKAGALSADDVESIEAIGNVRFVGEQADMESCYAAFDLYALASYREGFPRSAMEAAAMRLPVVATDIRGCRQVVDHDRSGVLVPARSVAELADAIAGLAVDPERRAAMGEAGREKAITDFDQRRCIDLTLAVYERLAGKAARVAVAA